MSNKTLQVNISGSGSNIGNVSHGDNNHLKAEINIAGVDNELSDSQKTLNGLLQELRETINSDEHLSKGQRQAAVSDLDAVIKEVEKSPDEQNTEEKQFFWQRFTEVVKFSTALMGLTGTIGKMLGIP